MRIVDSHLRHQSTNQPVTILTLYTLYTRNKIIYIACPYYIQIVAYVYDILIYLRMYILCYQLLMFFRRKSPREDTRFLQDLYTFTNVLYALWTTAFSTRPLWLRILFVYTSTIFGIRFTRYLYHEEIVYEKLFCSSYDDHCEEDRNIVVDRKFKSYNIIVYRDIRISVYVLMFCAILTWEKSFDKWSSGCFLVVVAARSSAKNIRIARGTVHRSTSLYILAAARRPHAQIDSHGKPKFYHIFRTCHCGLRRLFIIICFSVQYYYISLYVYIILFYYYVDQLSDSS